MNSKADNKKSRGKCKMINGIKYECTYPNKNPSEDSLQDIAKRMYKILEAYMTENNLQIDKN